MSFNMLKAAVEYMMPVLSSSYFLEKGVLTPEEFVQAGDQLVHSSPTWKWAGAPPSNTAATKAYLPPDKQYLVTTRVPCLRRVADAMHSDGTEAMIEQEDGSDGWLSTHANTSSSDDVSDLPTFDAPTTTTTTSTSSTASTTAPQPITTHDSNVSMDDIPDIDDVNGGASDNAGATMTSGASADDVPDFEAFDATDNLVRTLPDEEGDDGALPTSSRPTGNTASTITTITTATTATTSCSSSPTSSSTTLMAPGAFMRVEEPADTIIRTRTYDVSITYDKYYQTARVWLFGYDEYNQPLTGVQMMQDISADHANKTVTIEPHPYVNVAHASIHPCKHASVMKRIVEQYMLSSKQTTFDIRQYMFIFLKFISAVIPTIEYDYTMQ